MKNELSDQLIIERLTQRINKANTYFLQQIATNISRLKGLSRSDAHKLGQILKYGSNYKDIVKKLSKYLDANIEEVDDILKSYAEKDSRFYEKFYKYRNIKMPTIEQNTPLKTELNAISRMIKQQMYSFTRPNILGYTLTDINGKSQFYSLKDTFNKVIDEALLNVSQGKQTFDSSMSKMLTEIGQSGLRKIQYESGRSVRLDSVVRTQVLDGVRNLHNATQQIYGEQFDSDGVEITVHENPAPDHSNVQGRQFSTKSEDHKLSEWQKLQNGQDAKDYKGNTYNLDHDNKNGYRPISTMNCYHTVFSIILGVSKPQYTDQQLTEIKQNSEKLVEIDGKKYTRYQCTQLQRNLERRIREQKDIQIMAKQSDNKQLINKSQQKITQLTQKYKQISEQSNLPTKMNRLKVSGYKREKIDIKNSKINTTKPKELTKKTFDFELYKDKFESKGIYLQDDLKSMDSELLQRNIEHLDYLTDKYNVTSNQTLEINMKANENHIGTTWYRNNTVGFNHKYYDNKKNYLEQEQYSQKIKWHNSIKQDDLDLYTTTHEFGHVIENDYTRRYLKEHKGIDTSIKQDFYTYKEKALRQDIDKQIRDEMFSYIQKREKISITEIKNKYLSGYGKSKKHYEWFAETFAQMELGEQNLLTEAMRDWLERNKK